ncbi:hypothetical protein CHCC14821_3985 [Bacillus paralicheniformis]|nr:hypothetical protein CHCC14821_3985 [Bacillus paralicheniformis]TWM56368.1 hypothetical protein CHCC14814_2349 [Bacillus paralicheniformis]
MFSRNTHDFFIEFDKTIHVFSNDEKTCSEGIIYSGSAAAFDHMVKSDHQNDHKFIKHTLKKHENK